MHFLVVALLALPILNSLFMATSTPARGHAVEAIPLDPVGAILSRHNGTAR